jgi:hypothetical protein
MPTFRYDKLTATSYRVIDAHTGEAYGTVAAHLGTWRYYQPAWGINREGHAPTRDDAARALYAARHAHGFEAGAL